MMRKFNDYDQLGDIFLSIDAQPIVLDLEDKGLMSLPALSSAFTFGTSDFVAPRIDFDLPASGMHEPIMDTGHSEFTPADPLFSQQWYLNNTTAGQFDINVLDAWDDYSGAGVQVTVFDVGYDYAHVDLAANYNAAIDYDYSSGDFDPIATGGDNHGTAVMGIIGAVQGNGEGVVGVAFGASLVGYRGFALGASDSDDQLLDAAGLGDGVGNTNGNANGTDVISVSGGYGSSVFFTSANLDDGIDALEFIAANGRGGLGTIYVKSSGNSRAAANSSAREEGTAERFDSTEFSINVAALRQDGWVTDYSTPGANVLVSAFADDINNFGAITTTDRTGAPGYTSGDYTSTFSGTSSAAPQVAGVVALMLEANSDLGWRDVQMILAASARHAGSDVGTAANTGAAAFGGHEQATQTDGSSWFWNDASHWNGGGQHFSNDYGYGIVDATAAVRLAETWNLQSTTANRATTFEDGLNSTISLNSSSQDVTITETDDIRIEHVSIELTFSTTFLADMEVFLTSPSGTRVQLIADTGDSGDFNGTWRFGSTAFMGETSAGDWIVSLVDDAGSASTLMVTDIDLRTAGSAITADDVFIFTNEYSDYAGVDGHLTNFAGGTGTNTINAAAVTAAITIDLANGTGTIDGVGITMSGIANVFGGDGDDIITGDMLGNELWGGRGDDILNGGDGTDYALFYGVRTDYTIVDNGDGTWTISGGFEGSDTLSGIEFARFSDMDVALTAQFTEGNDNVDGTAGADMFFALGGNDIVNGLGGDDIIHGDAGNDTIHGNDDNDQLFGEDGIDRLFGDAGDDTLDGGIGNDILSGGAGDDIFIGGAGADTHLGSSGTDTLDFSASTSRVELDLAAGGTVGDAAGDSYNSIEVVIGTDFNDILRGGSASDTLRGGDGVDRLFGNGGFDVLDGGAGDDILSGGDDADRFIGGAGADVHLGGGGLDIIDYSASASAVTVNLDTGGTVGDAAGDTYFGVETVIGTAFDDTITGDSASETLIGGDGADTINGAGGYDLIDGGAGDDIMSGGVGHDRFLGGAGADSHDGGANIDTVDYRAATSGIELDLDLGGTVGDAAGDSYVDIERILGSDFDDVIIGSAGNDNLHGYAGDDYIHGSNGNDVLFGEAGDDAFGYDTAVDGYDTLADFVTGAGSDDVIHIFGDPAFDTFAEVMAVAYESGTSTVFNFGGVMRLRVLNSQISDFHSDDFDFSGPPPGNGGGETKAEETLDVLPYAEAFNLSDYDFGFAEFDSLDIIL